MCVSLACSSRRNRRNAHTHTYTVATNASVTVLCTIRRTYGQLSTLYYTVIGGTLIERVTSAHSLLVPVRVRGFVFCLLVFVGPTDCNEYFRLCRRVHSFRGGAVVVAVVSVVFAFRFKLTGIQSDSSDQMIGPIKSANVLRDLSRTTMIRTVCTVNH